jgi:hypothetical protein
MPDYVNPGGKFHIFTHLNVYTASVLLTFENNRKYPYN